MEAENNENFALVHSFGVVLASGHPVVDSLPDYLVVDASVTAYWDYGYSRL